MLTERRSSRPATTSPEPPVDRRRPPRWAVQAWAAVNSSNLSRVGAVLIVVVIFFAIFAPLLAGGPLVESNSILSGPSWAHPFGTDEFGRDILSRSAVGARVSLLVAVVSVALGVVGGMLVGLCAGYFGGRFVDELLMRATDTLLSLPLFVLALFVLGIVGPGPVHVLGLTLPESSKVIFLISLASLPFFVRVARAATLVELQEDYVVSLRVIGLSPRRILFTEVGPNVLPVVLVQAWLWMAIAVLSEAALSYLGLGIVAPHPTLGNLLADATTYVFRGAWWYTVFPGLILLLLTVGLNLLGDGLSSARETQPSA